MNKLNKTMAIQIDALSNTMVKQINTYNEILTNYRALNQNEIATPFESLQLAFSKLHTSYLQTQKMIVEVFKPVEKYFGLELQALEGRLQEIKSLQSSLVSSERKLREKKNLLFTQQEFKKWELPTDCSVSMELLYSNKAVAFKEMLPKETMEINKVRKMHGYLCNKAKEEFNRINIKNRDLLSVSLFLTSKVNQHNIKEVIVD